MSLLSVSDVILFYIWHTLCTNNSVSRPTVGQQEKKKITNKRNKDYGKDYWN